MKDVVFTTVSPVRYWVHKILPLVYDDSLSYYEVLSKVTKTLNELIENNNNIPDYVAQMIREYITSGAIGEVVRDILADFMLNVKNPPYGITPAVGDGSADDTAAIQGCIDYAAENGYGCVYIPYGKYLVSPIEAKDNVSIFGYDRYSTGLYLKGGSNNALIYGNAENFGIYNLELNGSAGVQVYDVPVIELSGTNNLFSNLLINECYKGIVYNGSEGHLQIDNIVFGDCAEQGMNISGDVDVQCTNVEFNNLARLSNSPLVSIASDNGYYLINSKATCDTCVSVSGNGNMITGFIENSVNPFVDTGANNYIYASKYYFKLPVNTIDLISNTYSLATTGNATENIGGDKNTTVHGNLSERIFKDVRVDVIGDADFTLVGEAIVGESRLSAEEGSNVDINIIGEVNATATGAYNVKGKNFNGKFDDYFRVYGKETRLETNEVILDPDDAVTYQTPKPFDDNFDYIPFKDYNGNEYKVAVVRSGISTSVRYAKYFANTDCVVGTITRTNGFYSANDGGSAWYYIDSTGSADNITSFRTKNGYTAKLVIEPAMNFKQFGGATNLADCTAILNSAINYCGAYASIEFNSGDTYNFSNVVKLKEGTHLIVNSIMNSTNNGFWFESFDNTQHPGYTGNGNITIEGNGVFDMHGVTHRYVATLLRLGHGHDITVKDITIREYGCYHAIEVMGCKNVLIDNVKFLGAYSRSDLVAYPESAIQIEPVSPGAGQGGVEPKDNTTCQYVTVRNCLFSRSDNDNSILCDAGIESQNTGVAGLQHVGIDIYNNTFEYLRKSCIYAWEWAFGKIHNNTCTDIGGGFLDQLSTNQPGMILGSVCNNVINNVQTDTTRNVPVFNLAGYIDTVISGNVISTAYADTFVIRGGSELRIDNNIMQGCLRGNVVEGQARYSFFNIPPQNKPTRLAITNNTCVVTADDDISNSIGSGIKPDIFSGNITNLRAVYNTYYTQYWSGTNIVYTGSLSSGSISDYANFYYDDLLVVNCGVSGFGDRTFVFDNTDKTNNTRSIEFNTISGDGGTVVTRMITFTLANTGMTITSNYSSDASSKISIKAVKTVRLNKYVI